ncbi:unnamed protein product [Closterium sp. Naga37s-1]|nr:unnamed protein product [Closterium sp. Naga37s-1]
MAAPHSSCTTALPPPPPLLPPFLLPPFLPPLHPSTGACPQGAGALTTEALSPPFRVPGSLLRLTDYHRSTMKPREYIHARSGRRGDEGGMTVKKSEVPEVVHEQPTHRKVLFSVACRRLRLAGSGSRSSHLCPTASSSSSSSSGSSSGGAGYGPVYLLQSCINDVIFIFHEARNAPKVREHCREWLAAQGAANDNVEPHSQANLLPHTHAWPLGHGAQPSHSLR